MKQPNIWPSPFSNKLSESFAIKDDTYGHSWMPIMHQTSCRFTKWGRGRCLDFCSTPRADSSSFLRMRRQLLSCKALGSASRIPALAHDAFLRQLWSQQSGHQVDVGWIGHAIVRHQHQLDSSRAILCTDPLSIALLQLVRGVLHWMAMPPLLQMNAKEYGMASVFD